MNLNKVYLIGRLASDPEFRTTPSGQEITNLRMVTNRIWTDQSGQKNENPEFHSIVAWGRLAQIANQYLIKGSLVMIEGRLQTRSWEGQDGVKRYRTEIVAENLQLGPKPFGKDGARPSGFSKEESSAKSQREDLPSVALPAQAGSAKEEIPVVNEDQPTDDSEVEESEVQLKDVPF